MTAIWEMQLTDISKKQASYQQFMSDLQNKLPELLRSPNPAVLQNFAQITPLVKSHKPTYASKRKQNAEK